MMINLLAMGCNPTKDGAVSPKQGGSVRMKLTTSQSESVRGGVVVRMLW